ncbi:MAG TPA: hypothetical protein VGP72_28745 [Planctomycetota bacterium]|jgi:hypothetical protein
MSDEFFRIGTRDLPVQWHANGKFEQLVDGTLDRCFDGTLIRKQPLAMVLKGLRRVDITMAGPGTMISEKARSIFERGGFSGWRTFPIKLKTKRSLKEKFFGLVVTGRTPVIGDIFQKPERIKKKNWDGSDFFLLKDGERVTGVTVVTKRVVEAAQRAGLSGAVFHPIVAE